METIPALSARTEELLSVFAELAPDTHPQSLTLSCSVLLRFNCSYQLSHPPPSHVRPVSSRGTRLAEFSLVPGVGAWLEPADLRCKRLFAGLTGSGSAALPVQTRPSTPGTGSWVCPSRHWVELNSLTQLVIVKIQ